MPSATQTAVMDFADATPRASSSSRFSPDPHQTAVIEHDGGPARVNAGAGTGKSMTMTLRIRRLILSGVAGSAILAITFTRKGADALVAKLAELCGDLSGNVTVGTFHAIAIQEMVSHMPAGDRWHVLDEDDADHFWTQACTDTAAEMLPKLFGLELFTGTKHPNKELEKRIRNLFNALREIRSFQVNMNKGAEPFSPFAASRLAERSASYRALLQHPSNPNFQAYFDEVLQRYERLKRINNGRDYDDLLLAWRDLLSTNAEYRADVRNRWRHVIVDEYQDTNYLQEDIIQLLNTENLMVVGDIAQCIYSWRSAVPKLMIEFRSRYGATDLPLEFNYRSRSEIIDVANGILKLHHTMLARSGPVDLAAANPLLQLRHTRGTGGQVRFIAGADRHHETQLVAGAIEGLLRRGVAPRSIAVLSRVSYYTGPLEARLRAMSFEGKLIDVQVWGGRSLLDSATAKDVLAALKCLARPADPWPFIRLACLHAGVGEVAAGQGFFRRMFCLPAPIALQGLYGLLADLDAIHRRRDRASGDRLSMIVLAACEYLRKVYASDTKSDETTMRQRLSDLDAIKIGVLGAINDMARRAEETSQPLHLADLINTFSLDPQRDRTNDEALTISTVHSAKGLEWPHVFVVGANEGTMPVLRKRDEGSELSTEQIAQARADLEEECRILYVALTRARDHLTVSFAADSGASRFLMSVPDIKNRCVAAEEQMGATSRPRYQ